MRAWHSWKRDGHPGGPNHQAHADPHQWLSRKFGRRRPDGSDRCGVAEHCGQFIRFVDFWAPGVSVHHLFPISRNKRIVVFHNRVHHRAIHRHMSPDQSAVFMYALQGEENHYRSLGLHLALLRNVVLPIRHPTGGLQGCDYSNVRLQSVQKPLPTDIFFRLWHLLCSATHSCDCHVRSHCENFVS